MKALMGTQVKYYTKILASSCTKLAAAAIAAWTQKFFRFFEALQSTAADKINREVKPAAA